jgi:hypothetical protein
VFDVWQRFDGRENASNPFQTNKKKLRARHLNGNPSKHGRSMWLDIALDVIFGVTIFSSIVYLLLREPREPK